MPDIREEQFSLELLRLTKKKEYIAAYALIKDRQLHESWCDTATAICAYNHDNSKAHEIINHARNNYDVITWHNCILECATATLDIHLKDTDKEGISFGQANPEDYQVLELISETLSPIIEHVKADKRISNPLELRAVLLMINAAIILGRIVLINELATLLKEYKPLPLEYVGLVLGRLVPVSPDISTRLHNEHTDNLEAKLLAHVVEAELYNNTDNAFAECIKLTNQVNTDTDKYNLCGVLFQISQLLDDKAMQQTYKISSELLSESSTLANVIRAAIELRHNNIQKAKEILDNSKDENNPLWLQLYAFSHFADNDYKKGIMYFTKATEKLSSIEMYKIIGEAAYKGGFVDKAIEAFEIILKTTPNNDNIRAKLSELYYKTNDINKSEHNLRILWNNNQNNISYGMNYAACLITLGKTDDALKIYSRLCDNNEPPLEALLAISHLYKIKHQPLEGFNYLNKNKDIYWDSAPFLLAYVDLGYASGKDNHAHDAFLQILKLRADGKFPHEAVQSKSLDDLLNYHKQWINKTEKVCDLLLQGKASWQIADMLLNNVTYKGWAIRTQSIPWITDDLASKATFCIYSTNNFHPMDADGGGKKLKPLPFPEKGSPVVIDLSSLITLHRLGLLKDTCNYFSNIYISNNYISHLTHESGMLNYHQPSEIEATSVIKRDVDAGLITILSEADERKYPFINEYPLESDNLHYYSLRDIHKSLQEFSNISKDINKMFTSVCHKPSGIDKDHPELRYGDSITIEINTFKTLIGIEAYNSILDSFRIHITEKDYNAALKEIANFNWLIDVQNWNDDLILSLSHYEIVNAPNDNINVWLDAYNIATNRNINLMADDRFLQVLALNIPDYKMNVFSTDCLLKAFDSHDFIDEHRIAEAFLQLIRWRYRFIIPSVKMLKYYAVQYEASPPGVELTEIARYVHDCMRDPGLFYGPEKTTPPIPMACWLFGNWAHVTFDFILEIWKDRNIPEDIAYNFTLWAVTELLPSPPKYLIPGRIKVVDDLIVTYIKEGIINIAIYIRDNIRASKAISSLKEAMQLTDEMYYNIFTEILDMTRTKYV